MLNDLLLILVRCLLITLIAECGCALLLGVRDRLDLINVALVNVMTNPPVVACMFLTGFFFGSRVRTPVEIGLEVLVVLAEGFVYSKVLKYKKIPALLLSLLLNAASYGIGWIVNLLI